MLCVGVCRFTDNKNFELCLMINRLGPDGHPVAKKKEKQKKKKKKKGKKERKNWCNEVGLAQLSGK